MIVKIVASEAEVKWLFMRVEQEQLAYCIYTRDCVAGNFIPEPKPGSRDWRKLHRIAELNAEVMTLNGHNVLLRSEFCDADKIDPDNFGVFQEFKHTVDKKNLKVITVVVRRESDHLIAQELFNIGAWYADTIEEIFAELKQVYFKKDESDVDETKEVCDES